MLTHNLRRRPYAALQAPCTNAASCMIVPHPPRNIPKHDLKFGALSRKPSQVLAAFPHILFAVGWGLMMEHCVYPYFSVPQVYAKGGNLVDTFGGKPRFALMTVG